jgi:hypothetical protein
MERKKRGLQPTLDHLCEAAGLLMSSFNEEEVLAFSGKRPRRQCTLHTGSYREGKGETIADNEFKLRAVHDHQFKEGTVYFLVQYLWKRWEGRRWSKWIPYTEDGVDYLQWEPLSCFVFNHGMAVTDKILKYSEGIVATPSQKCMLRQQGLFLF